MHAAFLSGLVSVVVASGPAAAAPGSASGPGVPLPSAGARPAPLLAPARPGGGARPRAAAAPGCGGALLAALLTEAATGATLPGLGDPGGDDWQQRRWLDDQLADRAGDPAAGRQLDRQLRGR